MPVNIGFADVVPGRLELPTSTLSVWRSSHLSYRTGRKLAAGLPPRLSLVYRFHKTLVEK